MPDSMTEFDAAARHRLLQQNADGYLVLAFENILREYPHMPWIIASGPESYRLHRDAHPVFFGSFDWHSCVEMYWVAIRMMRLFPELEHEAEARETIDSLMTPENIAMEEDFFLDPSHGSFERPYGWGWLLQLWHELALWDDADGRRWHETLAPLAETLMDRFEAWLPKMTYPQRIGMHANTAFGLVLAWEAIERERPALMQLVRERAMTWFVDDTDYPARYEPSGADFLSAALTEAVLIGRVLGPDAYPAWLEAFLPGIAEGQPEALFTPAVVTDASDGQIAHLHGLNLSRAWGFLWIARHLPKGDVRIDRLERAARDHATASLHEVSGSHYMVEHWLSAYATLALSEG
jgi:hypothetical protein